MTFDFETDEPKVFVEEKMRTIFNMYHDMKSELRDYNLAELQEVKEFASSYTRLGTSPFRNDIVRQFANQIVQQVRYRMAVLREMEREVIDD